MNEYLVEIIDQYLKIESNYAVLLTGEYGIGKTHFFKNELSNKICETPLPSNDQKKYHPIHISLFGLKSVEEIQSQIFIELYSFLKETGLKLAFGIGKSIIRGYAKLKGLGDVNDFFADINVPKEKWLNYNELVICIDDIDRKSGKLHLDEILGFINSLVENLGAKVIIIANESEIKDLTSELREKVIGVTIHFKPDVLVVFNKIIEERYSSSYRIYYDFLRQNEGYIVTVVQSNKNNFRNLIYFLEHFKLIFNSLEAKFQESEDFIIQKEEKQKLILDFSLAISIEFKLGKINTDNLLEIKSYFNDNLIWLSESLNLTQNDVYSGKEVIPEITYEEEFRNKYFSNKKKHFFNNVFGYLTGQAAFRIDELVSELNQVYKIVNGSVPSEVQVYQKLYTECFELTDKEYRDLTRQMMVFVDQGKYELNQYHNIFHFATRFDNFMNYKLESLKKRFKKGIRKGINDYKYISDLGFYMSVHSNTEYKQEIEEIISYCVELNKNLKVEKEIKEKDDLFILFQNETDEFFEKISENQSPLQYRPFWNNFDTKAVYRKIIRMTSQEILNVSRYFGSRYYQNVPLEILVEKQFVEDLIVLIEAPKNRKQNNLKNAALNILISNLTNNLVNFRE